MAEENNQQQGQQQGEQAASPKTTPEQNVPVTGEGAPSIDSVDTSLQANDTPTVYQQLVAKEAQLAATVKEGQTCLLRVVATNVDDTYQLQLGYRQREDSPLAAGFVGDERFGLGLTLHWLTVKKENLAAFGIDFDKLEFVESQPLSEDADSKQVAFIFMPKVKHSSGRTLAVNVQEFTEDELVEQLSSLMEEGGYSIDEIADGDVEEASQQLRTFAWNIANREQRAKRTGKGKMYACAKRADGTFQPIYRFTAVGWKSQELEDKLVNTDLGRLQIPELIGAEVADVMEEEAVTE